MKAKQGVVVKGVSPATPSKVIEADEADPGKVAKTKAKQLAAKKGKYGATKTSPFKAIEDDNKDSSGWIEIELLDEDRNPVSSTKYEVTLPDGTVASGTTDAAGIAKIEGFEPGECKVSFPDIDKDGWKLK